MTTEFDDISREGLIDMLEEATERLEEKSALIRELREKLMTAQYDRVAYLGALGNGIPNSHDGKLSDGTELVNYVANALQEANGFLQERLELYEDAVQQLEVWSKAYPISAFPEPDMKLAHQLLEAGGLTLDAVSASNMRHVLTRVREIIAKLNPIRLEESPE